MRNDELTRQSMGLAVSIIDPDHKQALFGTAVQN